MLQWCHLFVCLLRVYLGVPVGAGPSPTSLLSQEPSGALAHDSWLNKGLDGGGVLSSNGSGGQGHRDSTEGLSKPTEVPRAPFSLVSDSSTSFKTCGL